MTFRETNTAVIVNDFITEYERENSSDLCIYPSSYEHTIWFLQRRILRGLWVPRFENTYNLPGYIST